MAEDLSAFVNIMARMSEDERREFYLNFVREQRDNDDN